MSGKITILGCGTSGGVPQLHTSWGTCDPAEPKNHRSRASILIEQADKILLVDTTPECRLQLLNHDIMRIDGLIYTHTHADHCHGIDETRWICQAQKRALPTYSFAPFLDDLQHRFPYAFSPLKPGAKTFHKPLLLPHPLTPMQHFSTAGMTLLPFELNHGFSTVLGLRIGDFAYCTDVAQLSKENFRALEGIRTWVVDCLRPTPHPTHAHLERTLEWVARLKPEQTYLTHMNGDMDYQTLLHTLPHGVAPAFDGLVLPFNPN